MKNEVMDIPSTTSDEEESQPNFTSRHHNHRFHQTTERRTVDLLLTISDNDLDGELAFLGSIPFEELTCMAPWPDALPNARFCLRPRKKKKGLQLGSPSDEKEYMTFGTVESPQTLGPIINKFSFARNDMPASIVLSNRCCIDPHSYQYLPDNGHYRRAKETGSRLESPLNRDLVAVRCNKRVDRYKLTPGQLELQRKICDELRREYEPEEAEEAISENKSRRILSACSDSFQKRDRIFNCGPNAGNGSTNTSSRATSSSLPCSSSVAHQRAEGSALQNAEDSTPINYREILVLGIDRKDEISKEPSYSSPSTKSKKQTEFSKDTSSSKHFQSNDCNQREIPLFDPSSKLDNKSIYALDSHDVNGLEMHVKHKPSRVRQLPGTKRPMNVMNLNSVTLTVPFEAPSPSSKVRSKPKHSALPPSSVQNLAILPEVVAVHSLKVKKSSNV